MAEVGLLPFTRVALQTSHAMLRRYRSRFSKHQFQQPQFLAILCLMRYEDWTFREAEVRLDEHRALRQVLGLGRGRLHDLILLPATSGRSNHRPGGRRHGAPVPCRAQKRAEASSRRGRCRGLGAGGGQYLRRMHQHGQKPLPWKPIA
jgi:hypothetical protein